MKLTFKVLINAETPTKWMNAWEDDARDLCHVLWEIVGDGSDSKGVLVDERIIPVDDSDVWYGLGDLNGNDSIHSVTYNGEVDREGLEKIASSFHIYGSCDTGGMLGEDGWLPAKSFEVEMPNSYVSFYLCPLVDGEVPNEVNFNRIIRAIENL